MKLNLGENIRKYRKRIDWTQEQLADRLGVSYQSVSRWESGNGYPDMEHLPTMARLFSVTMDDLIGYGDENEKLPNQEMEKKFRETLEKGNIDEIVSLMRLLRYEYLDEFDQIFFPLYHAASRNKLNESPKFMEELRLLVGEYLKHGKQEWAKMSLIEIMIDLEDDEHFERLVEEHNTPENYDLSINGMFMRRAEAKDDDETYKYTRAVNKMQTMYEYFHRDRLVWYKKWDPAWKGIVPENIEDDLPDVPELDPFICAERSRRKLRMLHDFNGVDPDEKHPVSGDGELDLWFTVRMEIGFFYAAQLSVCGEHDLALTVLEDCTDLIEQAHDFPADREEYRKCRKFGGLDWPALTCKSPELAGITAYRSMCDIADTDLPPEISISYRPEREFKHIKAPFEHFSLGILQHWQYSCLTEQQIPREGFRSSWFDPIRNHPRYLAVVERILRAEGDGSCTARKHKPAEDSSSDT